MQASGPNGSGARRDGGRSSGERPTEAFEAGAAPRDDPLIYPGAMPSFSFLFLGGDIERLDVVDAHGIGGGELAARLDELGSAPMAHRQPLLAFGSNRSPAQLASKFAEASIDRVFPVVRGRLGGLSVVFAAYVARYGSIPATLVDDPGSSTEVAVMFLDEDQLDVMDATERGQRRRTLDPDRHPLQLPAGDELVGCQRYRSPRSTLTWDGRPIRLSEVGSTGSALGSRSQAELQGLLLAWWPPSVGTFADANTFVGAVRSPEVHRAANDALDDLEANPASRFGALGAFGAGELDQ